jgi:phosphatidylserine/phosphatidylglycerophosphate/cardiolipin synthase-like enzyme
LRKSLGRGVVWGFLALLLLGAHPVPAQTVPARASLLEDGAYGRELITRIGQAKRRIICAFYLFKVGDRRGNLPAAVARELVRARQRGVEVTVILEGEKPVGDDNRAAASLLARGGVRVLLARGKKATHVKAIAIDDRYVLLGSHNLSHSALSRNDELSVLLDAPELAAQVGRYLERIR